MNKILLCGITWVLFISLSSHATLRDDIRHFLQDNKFRELYALCEQFSSENVDIVIQEALFYHLEVMIPSVITELLAKSPRFTSLLSLIDQWSENNDQSKQFEEYLSLFSIETQIAIVVFAIDYLVIRTRAIPEQLSSLFIHYFSRFERYSGSSQPPAKEQWNTLENRRCYILGRVGQVWLPYGVIYHNHAFLKTLVSFFAPRRSFILYYMHRGEIDLFNHALTNLDYQTISLFVETGQANLRLDRVQQSFNTLFQNYIGYLDIETMLFPEIDTYEKIIFYLLEQGVPFDLKKFYEIIHPKSAFLLMYFEKKLGRLPFAVLLENNNAVRSLIDEGVMDNLFLALTFAIHQLKNSILEHLLPLASAEQLRCLYALSLRIRDFFIEYNEHILHTRQENAALDPGFKQALKNIDDIITIMQRRSQNEIVKELQSLDLHAESEIRMHLKKKNIYINDFILNKAVQEKNISILQRLMAAGLLFQNFPVERFGECLLASPDFFYFVFQRNKNFFYPEQVLKLFKFFLIHHQDRYVDEILNYMLHKYHLFLVEPSFFEDYYEEFLNPEKVIFILRSLIEAHHITLLNKFCGMLRQCSYPITECIEIAWKELQETYTWLKNSSFQQSIVGDDVVAHPLFSAVLQRNRQRIRYFITNADIDVNHIFNALSYITTFGDEIIVDILLPYDHTKLLPILIQRCHEELFVNHTLSENLKVLIANLFWMVLAKGDENFFKELFFMAQQHSKGLYEQLLVTVIVLINSLKNPEESLSFLMKIHRDDAFYYLNTFFSVHNHMSLLFYKLLLSYGYLTNFDHIYWLFDALLMRNDTESILYVLNSLDLVPQALQKIAHLCETYNRQELAEMIIARDKKDRLLSNAFKKLKLDNHCVIPHSISLPTLSGPSSQAALLAIRHFLSLNSYNS